MSKLTHDFYAAMPGEIYPQTFAKGTDCPDPLVTIARSLGILDEGKKSRKASPENKMVKSAPENKGA